MNRQGLSPAAARTLAQRDEFTGFGRIHQHRIPGNTFESLQGAAYGVDTLTWPDAPAEGEGASVNQFSNIVAIEYDLKKQPQYVLATQAGWLNLYDPGEAGAPPFTVQLASPVAVTYVGMNESQIMFQGYSLVASVPEEPNPSTGEPYAVDFTWLAWY